MAEETKTSGAGFTDANTTQIAGNAPATDAIVDKWHADHFPGSVVAQNTEVWNHVHAAVQELKKRLARR